MKKNLVFICLIIVIITSAIFPISMVYADTVEEVVTEEDSTPSEDERKGTGTVLLPSIGGGKEVNVTLSIITGNVKIVAWAVAVGMMLIIGIKYMTNGAGAKAEVKNTFLPYLIGAILVGAASKIAELVLSLY